METHKKYPISFIQIKIILIDKKKKGFSHVTFLGGEPTLYPNFEDLLVFTKKLGYKIMLISNGFGLQTKENAFKILSNIDEISLSIHGYNKETLSYQTGNNIAYNQLLKVIENITEFNYLHKNKVYYYANIVINSLNYSHVLDIIKFIQNTKYPWNQLLVSYIAPEGRALKKYKELSFDFNNFKAYIPEIISLCNSIKIKINFFGIPLCVLGEDNIVYSNDTHWTERNTIERFTTKDGKVTLIDIYSPDSSRERSFIDKCITCKWIKNPCTGIFNKYLEYYKF
ncbi:MAG: radical SAM protein [Candidatus Gracilibacteria bacterium]|nr:radical SAM protein [Candidatus Gracilibacteria bacterium]